MIKPLHDYVVLELDIQEDKERTTASGIILTSSTPQEKPQTGKVVAVGKGRLTETGGVVPLSVKVGDEVFFAKYSGTEMKYNNSNYLILRERDIMAVI